MKDFNPVSLLPHSTNPINLSPEGMLVEELRLEEEYSNEGMLQMLKNNNYAAKMGAGERTIEGKLILSSIHQAVTDSLVKALKDIREGKGGTKATLIYRLLKDVTDDNLGMIAMLSIRLLISAVVHKQSIDEPCQLNSTSIEIGHAINLELAGELANEADSKYLSRLLKKQRKYATTDQQKRFQAQAVIQVLTTQVAEGEAVAFKWGEHETLGLGLYIINLILAHLPELQVNKILKGKKTIYCIQTTETFESIMQDRKDFLQLHLDCNHPLVVPPFKRTSVLSGGYHSGTKSTTVPLIKGIYKHNLNINDYHDMAEVYKTINTLEDTKWIINNPVLNVMEYALEHNLTWGNLATTGELVLPPKPLDIKTNEEARKIWKGKASEVYAINSSLASKRILVNMAVKNAKRLRDFPAIHFIYKVDFRGRVYAVSNLNPQGTDFDKGLLTFAKGHELGERGAYWLAIQGANVAGNDKLSFNARVAWVQSCEDEIVAIAKDPLSNLGWFKGIGGLDSIDKPYQFLAFCFDYGRYVLEGKHNSHVSHIAVALDGSCSGIQHYSAMLLDEVGGKEVNLIPQDLPADVYQTVADKIVDQLNVLANKGTENTQEVNKEDQPYIKLGTKELAKRWLAFGINRKVCKRSVMTKVYGATINGYKDQLINDFIRPDARENKTASVFFGHETNCGMFLAMLLNQTIPLVVVAAKEAMDWLVKTNRLLTKTNKHSRWTSAVGFPVYQGYSKESIKRVRTVLNGIKVTLSYQKADHSNVDSRKQNTAVAPNFIHSCDASHLIRLVNGGKDAGIDSIQVIHDSFGCHAGKTELFYNIIRQTFVDLYTDNDPLEDFENHVRANVTEEEALAITPRPTKGSLDLQGVLESKYCFS